MVGVVVVVFHFLMFSSLLFSYTFSIAMVVCLFFSFLFFSSLTFISCWCCWVHSCSKCTHTPPLILCSFVPSFLPSFVPSFLLSFFLSSPRFYLNSSAQKIEKVAKGSIDLPTFSSWGCCATSAPLRFHILLFYRL